MFRIFGLLAIVLGVWFAAQLYLESAEELATDKLTATDPAAARSPAQRAGEKVRKSFAEGTETRERLMPDE
ncbi:MAG TPA: hypothetical protein VIY27_03925 [Myxococcota bacterium]